MSKQSVCPHWVDTINREFAFVVVGGGQKIAHFANGKFREFLGVEAFINLVRTKREQGVAVGDGGAGRAWLESPFRRTYIGVTFEPRKCDCKPKLNLWNGFAHIPREGDVQLFLMFVHDVICDSNETRYRYVLAWIAQLIQEPSKKPGTALVLRGEQGTGKTTFANMLRGIFGEHAISLTSAATLVRNFNAHVAGKVLVVIEETPVRAKEALIVKDIVTSDTLVCEPKGVDPFEAPNHIHLVLCTNERSAVHAQHDERRYCVLDISACHKEDTSYFERLDRWYKEGGAEALLQFLLSYDYSAVNLRVVPRTSGLLEQKLASLPLIDRAFYEMLQSGEVATGLPWEQAHPRWQVVDTINDEYRRKLENKVTPEQVGKRIKQLFPETRNVRATVGQRRDWSWLLPSLEIVHSQ